MVGVYYQFFCISRIEIEIYWGGGKAVFLPIIILHAFERLEKSELQLVLLLQMGNTYLANGVGTNAFTFWTFQFCGGWSGWTGHLATGFARSLSCSPFRPSKGTLVSTNDVIDMRHSLMALVPLAVCAVWISLTKLELKADVNGQFIHLKVDLDPNLNVSGFCYQVFLEVLMACLILGTAVCRLAYGRRPWETAGILLRTEHWDLEWIVDQG